jgi:hypothetical protein
MKSKLFFSLLSAIILIILINFSSAFIVTDTHDWLAKQALSKSSSSTYGKIVSEHFDDFSACMSMTDYSVFFYFQQGFSTIGKVYLASHNNLICPRAIELANKNNPSEVACALGICSMEFLDEPSHNDFIPSVVEKTGLVNGLVHAPAEECVNKKISTSELKAEGKGALVNKYPIHRNFLIKVFQSDNRATTIDVGVMMDAFVAEVATNTEYTVGFRGFTAIPTSLHIILILWFLFGMVSLTYLVKKKDKTRFNKISIWLCILLFILPVIFLYVAYGTGNIWKVFQFVTTPLCPIMPISEYEQSLQKAISNEVNLFNNGAGASYQLRDPAGLQNLANADAGNVWKLWVFGLMLAILIGIFVYLNFKRKK